MAEVESRFWLPNRVLASPHQRKKIPESRGARGRASLMPSANGRLARFLLDWSAGQVQQNGHWRALLTLTHEEIGEMIGASREAVTRHLAEFKRKNLNGLRGPCIVVKSQVLLEQFVKA